MGCGSSTSKDATPVHIPNGASGSNGASATNTNGAQKTAAKQRRRLSVAPGHVGDITPGAAGEGVTDDDTSVNLTDVERKAKGTLEHAIVSRKGYVPYSKKKVNQDRPVLKYAVGNNPEVSMFGVMDGHGEFGHEVSSFVQMHLPEYLGKNVQHVVSDPDSGIKKAVAEMVSQLHNESGINISFSGTTCVFAVKVGEILYIANIGDSRCVLAQQKDDRINAVDLSYDHKPEAPAEKERIIKAGGRVEPLPGPPGEDCGPMRVWLGDVDVPGLAMSRSIGDEISQTVGVISVPEITTHKIAKEDLYCIFASDGVWEFMTSQEVVDLCTKLLKTKSLDEVAKELVEESTQRWKQVFSHFVLLS